MKTEPASSVPVSSSPSVLFQETWTPSTSKSLAVTAQATCDFLKKLLTLEEEGEEFVQMLQQGVSSFAHSEEVRFDFMKACLSVLSVDGFGAYNAPQRRNALLMLQDMSTRGWQFTFTHVRVVEIMEVLTRQSQMHATLEHDVLPEALKELTLLGFPWHHEHEGRIVALSLLKASSNMMLARLATALRKANISLCHTEAVREKMEQDVERILYVHLTRTADISAPSPQVHDACSRALIDLVAHTGGVPFLTRIQTFLEKFHTPENKQDHTIMSYWRTFSPDMLQYCQRLRDEVVLKDTLALTDSPEAASSPKTRRRV